MADLPLLEAVVFDAGGTLVRIDFEWLSAMLAELGVAASVEGLRRAEVRGRRMYDLAARSPRRMATHESHPPLGSIAPTEAYFAGMLEGAGCRHPVLEEALARMFEKAKPPSLLWGKPAEGAREMLAALPGLGLRACCVSNSDGRAEHHLIACDVREGLEFVVDSQLVGIEKPDPGIFRIALDKLGIAAERTAYVGDIRVVDESGSRAAGMHFILIDPAGDYGEPGGPSIARIGELPAFLAAHFRMPLAQGNVSVGNHSHPLGRSSREATGGSMDTLSPIRIPRAWLEPAHAVREVEIPGVTPWRRGKVRSVFEAGPDHFVIVASDRLSAYDSILPTPIPGKGAILSMISAFWMKKLAAAQPTHLVSDDPADFPEPYRSHSSWLGGRAQLVRRAERIDLECVVRGYLTGSGWREYKQTQSVCGIALPPGLQDGARLEPAIFTPATKSDEGHDENISFEHMIALLGRETSEALRTRSIGLFEEARAHAWSRGLVLADTKFEFGRIDGALALIDEALSPDSSRYWDRAEYDAGRLLSFDKQYVRDWLDRSGWNHEPPAPALPDDVVRRTQERYLEAIQRLSGGES